MHCVQDLHITKYIPGRASTYESSSRLHTPALFFFFFARSRADILAVREASKQPEL